MDRYIFLDIDGVLNTETNNPKYVTPSGWAGVYPSKMQLLKEIIDVTNAKIILSSTWRDSWYSDYDKCDEEAKYLTDQLKSFDITITDRIPGYSTMHRGQEIDKYVNDHNLKSWIVIDDYSFPDFKYYGITDSGNNPRWLHIGYSNGGGLQSKHVQQAIAMFKNQEKYIIIE